MKESRKKEMKRQQEAADKAFVKSLKKRHEEWADTKAKSKTVRVTLDIPKSVVATLKKHRHDIHANIQIRELAEQPAGKAMLAANDVADFLDSMLAKVEEDSKQ